MQIDSELQRRLVSALRGLPGMVSFETRDSLLAGLPGIALVRSQSDATTDLVSILSGLDAVGRLTTQGGIRPLMVVIDNALARVTDETEAANKLQDLKLQLARHYGGDAQPQPAGPVTPEALVFGRQRDARLPHRFVAGALEAAKSVARLAVPRIFDGKRRSETGYGTGWLIGPNLLITNRHVVEARDFGRREAPASREDFSAQASEVAIWFDYLEEARPGVPCTAARLIASDPTLDYALFELDAKAPALTNRRRLSLVARQPKLARGDRLNILQHPNGGPLQFAIRNNFFVEEREGQSGLRYQTDTEPGASGAPVLDEEWKVVGLHYASVRVTPTQVPQEVIDGKPIDVSMLNEAVPIHRVLEHLKTVAAEVYERCRP